MRSQLSFNHGFTLIELLVSVAIVAVIAAIAVPLYTQQSQQTYLAEVQGDLLSCGQGLERLASRRWSFESGDAGGGVIHPSICTPTSTERYDLTVAADATTFTLRADPIDDRAMDDTGFLTLDQAGTRIWDENGDNNIADHDRNWAYDGEDGGS